MPTGRELLFQSPWEPRELPAPPAGPQVWTEAWPGGWHPLFPNAGEPCLVNGTTHGFHGRASISEWQVITHGFGTGDLRYDDPSGLQLTRGFVVDGESLLVSNRVLNRGSAPAPFVFVEHLIFGEILAGPGGELEAPGGRVVTLSDDGVALARPGDVQPWPAASGEARTEDWSHWENKPLSRFGALVDLAEHRVAVRRGRHRVDVEWSGHSLPYLWLWLETGANPTMQGDQPIRCLGIEPASVPHSAGLSCADEEGSSVILQPGEEWLSWVRLTASSVAG